MKNFINLLILRITVIVLVYKISIFAWFKNVLSKYIIEFDKKFIIISSCKRRRKRQKISQMSEMFKMKIYKNIQKTKPFFDVITKLSKVLDYGSCSTFYVCPCYSTWKRYKHSGHFSRFRIIIGNFCTYLISHFFIVSTCNLHTDIPW
jgi:hypothetical protein